MSWHEYKGKFDPADFVVPPELEKGKSLRIQAYIQAAHYRLLNIVARSGHFPFEEQNDVIRWCVSFGLQYLDTLDPGLTRSVMSQANMMNRRAQDIQHEQKHAEWIETQRTAVSTFISAGDEESARDHVQYLWAETLKMPDEPPRALRWKEKYLDALRRLFPRYLPD